jgi:hypothetical protein
LNFIDGQYFLETSTQPERTKELCAKLLENQINYFDLNLNSSQSQNIEALTKYVFPGTSHYMSSYNFIPVQPMTTNYGRIFYTDFILNRRSKVGTQEVEPLKFELLCEICGRNDDTHKVNCSNGKRKI